MNRIKEVLVEKGVKQIWLAEQLVKSYNLVNTYLQNRQQPRLEILYEVANILEIDVKDLLKSNKVKI
jgi:transcriptional regulator with XRE-family HTH domain